MVRAVASNVENFMVKSFPASPTFWLAFEVVGGKGRIPMLIPSLSTSHITLRIGGQLTEGFFSSSSSLLLL